LILFELQLATGHHIIELLMVFLLVASRWSEVRIKGFKLNKAELEFKWWYGNVWLIRIHHKQSKPDWRIPFRVFIPSFLLGTIGYGFENQSF